MSWLEEKVLSLCGFFPRVSWKIFPIGEASLYMICELSKLSGSVVLEYSSQRVWKCTLINWRMCNHVLSGISFLKALSNIFPFCSTEQNAVTKHEVPSKRNLIPSFGARWERISNSQCHWFQATLKASRKLKDWNQSMLVWGWGVKTKRKSLVQKPGMKIHACLCKISPYQASKERSRKYQWKDWKIGILWLFESSGKR